MPSFRKVKRSRIVGVVLAALVWWKGPNALLMTPQQTGGIFGASSGNVAHASSATATKGSKSGGTRLFTGTGTILVAAGAGGFVGRKIIMGQQQLNETAGSIDDDDDLLDDQPIPQGDLEMAKLKMTDEEQETAEAAAQEAQEKAQAMVASMLERVREAQVRASEILEDTIASDPPSPVPSRPVPVPVLNDVAPMKSVEPEPAVIPAPPSAIATPAVPIGIPAAVPKAPKIETPAPAEKIPVQSTSVSPPVATPKAPTPAPAKKVPVQSSWMDAQRPKDPDSSSHQESSFPYQKRTQHWKRSPAAAQTRHGRTKAQAQVQFNRVARGARLSNSRGSWNGRGDGQ
jgi:hypothetical protein